MVRRTIDSTLNRSEFLRLSALLGGAAALSAFLEGCSKAGLDPQSLLTPPAMTVAPTPRQNPTPAPTSAPQQPTPTEVNVSPTAKPTEARIAFVQTRDRAEGVRKAIELLGLNPVAGKRVFLKPNYNSADPTPGSTHLDTLAVLVAALQGMGASRITLGDRSGMGSTRQVLEQAGVFKLSEKMGFEALVFDELQAEDWVKFQPPGSHWQDGFALPRPCIEAEALVQTCCLKTHRYGGDFTLSLKNSVGMAAKRLPGANYNYMQELHGSPHQRRMIAEINAAYTPALVVMDGVEAFISGGPDQGERVSPEVVLAGTDRIALDAVGVALLRYHGCKTEAGRGKIFAQEQIARAVELGLGVDSPEKIEIVTADAGSAAYRDRIKQVLLAG